MSVFLPGSFVPSESISELTLVWNVSVGLDAVKKFGGISGVAQIIEL